MFIFKFFSWKFQWPGPICSPYIIKDFSFPSTYNFLIRPVMRTNYRREEHNKVNIKCLHNWNKLITFFHTNWRKYWFLENFRLSIFDGFMRLRMSWTRFDYFWKMSGCLSVRLCMCVCDKNFTASVAQKLRNRISLNFILRVILI